MNLYRNFGNLLESWVTEGYPDLHYQSGHGVDILDSVSRDSVPLSSVKSESEDSGFETVSTTPCHSHQCSALTSDASHPVFGSTVDHVQPSPLSPSMCSSSSSCVSLSSVAPKTTCLKVEQALRRTESPSWRESLHQMERGATGPLYRCNTASFPTNCHPTSSRPHHQVARPRRTHSQPSDPKKAELYRKSLKYDQHCPPLDSQLAFADGNQYRLDKLSPGLLYLEQVCRMLENIAMLQQQNHSLQKELEILKSQHAEKECVSFHKEEIRYPASQSLQILGHEDPDSGPSRLKEPKGFRHRSVSDTQAAVSRHRRARFAQDEPIADILVEEPEGKDPLLENEHKKLSKIQKLKFTSFRRQGTQQSDSESKSFQPKKKTKLPKIFRSRTITTRL
ncbi:uncharacterized protein si:dkey-106l3.7 isoform X2 [Rhinichthys klamathensis goyatoka]|uniref:uncharacterized protein si:dkey-106l3.7 isoform X2 n=1 Tax=Rhinichthys klamathensis goyatoka TaxID=3034132 RepID=UPI0024B52267|nr:uncharacterized protein si:dkey-106l3.7 isoform X2 [Rhinichthys klamathensis goyatoka]